MSTRSGKRIHSSFHEDTSKPEVEHVVQSERKTRSKRIKENGEEFSASIVKTKKRTNYVAYPIDDDIVADTVNSKEEQAIPARSLRKNALKELNVVTSEGENSEPVFEPFKPVRTTRRTRKLDEDAENTKEHQNHVEEVVNIGKTKSKKDKKKKCIPQEEVDKTEVSKKNTKKKLKKVKRSHSMVIENIEPQETVNEGLNKSNMSVDSFHSAAGSPVKTTEEDLPIYFMSKKTDPEQANSTYLENVNETSAIIPEGRQTRSATRLSSITVSQNSPKSTNKSRKRKSSVNPDKSTNDVELEEFDTTLTNLPKKRKSSIRNVTDEKKADETFDKDEKDSTFDIEDLEKRKSAIKAAIVTPKSDTTFDIIETEDKNTTYDTEPSELTIAAKSHTVNDINYSQIDLTTNTVTENPAMDATFEKDNSNKSISRKSEIINTTYEKDSETNLKQASNSRKSSVINSTFDKNSISSDSSVLIEDTNKSLRNSVSQIQKQSTEMNSTFDKNEISNSTFDKIEKSDSTFDKDKKLDATFDKVSKSSLISSDNSNIRDLNITLDKSDVSRISITSDDSRENIINTTPVLIESSLDESKINMSKKSPKTLTPTPKNFNTPTKMNMSKISPKTPTPITPLKREGTFTKDGSDLEEPSQTKLSKTPTRKMSLPSPGCTPFLVSKSGTRMMNVTRSLEKSRRSSLVEPLPRTTKVMFCSPVNNPAVVMQQRRKVIKSNLKGSNKSFIFEESGSEARAAPRKRSYTHNDAEEARAKRSRLEPAAAGAGAARPLRARTASVGHTVKSDLGPIKPTTPKKEGRIPRTKLPNFAALHQKEFSKMESLDECQERRARRARQLLTPTGAVTVLERSSPRESPVETERKKSPIPPNEETKQPKSNKSKKENDARSAKKDKDTQQSSKNTHQSSKKDKDTRRSSKKEKETKKPDTPVKSLPTLKSLNPGYTRFGFKLNYDVNPFSIPTNPNASVVFSNKKNTVKKDNTKPLKEIKAIKRQTTLPSLIGNTSRKEVAKQAVMREKSFTDKRSLIRNENRTVIKGVRTNRRFELQMRMRNID